MSQLILDVTAVGSSNTWAIGVGGYDRVQSVARPDNDGTNYIIKSYPSTGRESYTCTPATRNVPTTAAVSSFVVTGRLFGNSTEQASLFVVSSGVASGPGPGADVVPPAAWTSYNVSQTQIGWTPALVNDASLEIGINKASWVGTGPSLLCTTLYGTINFTLAAPSATTSAATSINASGAVLNGAINPNGANATFPVSYYFEYGPTIAYGNTTTVITGQTGSSSIPTTATLTGLVSNTLYHFRMVATNADNTTNGTDLTFTTSAGDRILMVL